MNVPSTIFTPFADYHAALEQTASLWGVAPGYWDIWGNRHVTSPEVRRQILESLGVAAATLEDLNAAVEQRLWEEWNSVTLPVLVISENDRPPELAVRLPVELEDGRAHVELEWEDGWKGTAEHSMAALDLKATAELRGRWFVEKHIPLTVSPIGEHQLRVTIAGENGTRREGGTTLIVAPDRAWLPPELENGGKQAGLCVSLYGLHSARSWGCGDFSDLARLCAWVGERTGGSFVTLNPLHAIHNRQPFNTSPYLPNCIYYRNLIYLDVERIDDYQNSRWARALRSSAAVTEEIQRLNEAEYVEYERVQRLKVVFLKLAFRTFLRQYGTGTPRDREFLTFIEQEGDLLDRYAVYCALDEWIHRRDPDVWTWPEWPAEFQDPASEATRAFAQRHWRSVLFYKYVQWQINRQLAEAQAAAREYGLSIGLFHDLALATDRCGSDLWAHRGYFVSGCRVGAPPDDFAPKGQDWSFPPPASERHWRDAYRLFRESIRKSSRHGGALRIDHVMRFFRLFWIPAGKEALDGTYVEDRYQDLLRVLALESVQRQMVVVGEDLGTVDPATRETLARFGILSYRLFYFEKDERGDLRSPEEYPAQALVSSTTHDLPTLAGFWCEADIDARRRAGFFPDDAAYEQARAQRLGEKQKMLDSLHRLDLLPEYVSRSAADLPELTGELHNAVIGFLASTPSMLFALNQEDLTKETEQQNLPGTTAEYPNWRRKMRYSIEDLETDPTVADFVRMYRNWLERTGRLAD